jgi:hypothetical protein
MQRARFILPRSREWKEKRITYVREMMLMNIHGIDRSTRMRASVISLIVTHPNHRVLLIFLLRQLLYTKENPVNSITARCYLAFVFLEQLALPSLSLSPFAIYIKKKN